MIFLSLLLYIDSFLSSNLYCLQFLQLAVEFSSHSFDVAAFGVDIMILYSMH